MSRSRKKTAVWADKQDKSAKRAATKQIRRIPIDSPVSNGSAWIKKHFCSYDIRDYCFLVVPEGYDTLEEFEEDKEKATRK